MRFWPIIIFVSSQKIICDHWSIVLDETLQPVLWLNLAASSFRVFRLLTDFVCLYNYEFWLSLCKIVRSSVILLLPLFVVCWFSRYEKELCHPEEWFFGYPLSVASFQCFLFLSFASNISWLFYCWCLSYFALHSSKKLHFTNLELFLSARWLVPYRAVPLLLSRRLFVYLRGIIKLWTTAGVL